MKSIAIIALVQNTSAIQLNAEFVNLAQGADINELGILGGNSGGNQEQSELGGMPNELGFGGGGQEMDELGLGPPPVSGASMKNVATGAPPPGFAEYMKKKAEKAN